MNIKNELNNTVNVLAKIDDQLQKNYIGLYMHKSTEQDQEKASKKMEENLYQRGEVLKAMSILENLYWHLDDK